MHFIGKPLMVEEHRRVGHLIFVFEMAYCLTLLKWSWQMTVIPELLQYGSDFSAQVSLHSQANDFFFFFRIHCLGYPTMYISLMMQWCLKRLISLARLYYSSVKFLILFIVTFLGTINHQYLWQCTEGSLEVCNSMCFLCLFSGDVLLQLFLFFQNCSKFITSGYRARSPCESLLWSPGGVSYWAVLARVFQRHAQFLI